MQSENGSLTDLDNRPIGKAFTMEPGQIVRLNNEVVEVLEVRNGLPSKAQFRFTFPLDDPGFLWLRWDNGTYIPFTPPEIGEEVTIEGAYTIKCVFIDNVFRIALFSFIPTHYIYSLSLPSFRLGQLPMQQPDATQRF